MDLFVRTVPTYKCCEVDIASRHWYEADVDSKYFPHALFFEHSELQNVTVLIFESRVGGHGKQQVAFYAQVRPKVKGGNSGELNDFSILTVQAELPGVG